MAETTVSGEGTSTIGDREQETGHSQPASASAEIFGDWLPGRATLLRVIQAASREGGYKYVRQPGGRYWDPIEPLCKDLLALYRDGGHLPTYYGAALDEAAGTPGPWDAWWLDHGYVALVIGRRQPNGKIDWQMVCDLCTADAMRKFKHPAAAG